MEDKRCTNCGRFPFCLYQGVCEHYIESNMANGDYWIKRDVQLHLADKDGLNFDFRKVN